ncbi:MAG: divergent polysaccharide deacetylase family protein [Spirochaetes bacterium]|nr:divergent polysaccharide deacetylase family protein [Brevinematales bacterium]MCL1958827.1 divergent polysaccharide deacetylase family protein [Spirochaetota bacterium]
MKKPEKAVKKTVTMKKTTSRTGKKSANSAAAGKRQKKTVSDALRAFMLAGILVILSIIISSAVIMIHSIEKSGTQDISEGVEFLPPIITESEITKTIPPVSSETKTVPSSTKPQTTVTKTPAAVTSSGASSGTSNKNTGMIEKPAVNLGTLAFVIDDAGNNLQELEPFLKMPAALTIAVLPGLPHSAEAARRIRAAGKEVILHQPMEAIGGQNPGPSAIYSGMSANEIKAILAKNIAEVGPVAGINNHQGSKVTMDREMMETILRFCVERGIYFLDSRTTSETVVPEAARQIGMKIAERDTFIDNEQDKASMLRYITGGLERAQKNGSSIMIGHTWSPQLAPLLAEQLPLFVKQGYTVRTASDIIKLK